VAKRKIKKKVFVVKHIVDDKTKKTSTVGPFHDKEEALATCTMFLKKGMCSWLVKYDG